MRDRLFRRWNQPDPPREAWRWVLAVKYVVLAAAVMWFAVDLARVKAEADPLVSVFRREGLMQPSALVIGVLVASLVFRRFGCRALCPTGAFLSVLGGIRFLRRPMPVPVPARCDMGVRSVRQLDCLHCGRCRVADAKPVAGQNRWTYVLMAVAAAGVVLVAGRVWEVAGVGGGPEQVQEEGITRGKPANTEAIRSLIDQSRLSDHEALHYHPYDPGSVVK